MRVDELGRIDPEVLMAATLTVLDSMSDSKTDGPPTCKHLPPGEINALTESLCEKFHQILCQIRGRPPCEVFGDREFFMQHSMALQTIIVASFAIGHTCGEAAPSISGIVH